jgi:hypothetical protein
LTKECNEAGRAITGYVALITTLTRSSFQPTTYSNSLPLKGFVTYSMYRENSIFSARQDYVSFGKEFARYPLANAGIRDW